MVFLFLLLLPLSLAGIFIQETNQTISATKVFSIDWTNEIHECVPAFAPNVIQKYVLLPYNNSYAEYEPGSINYAVFFNRDVKIAQDRGAIGVLFVGDSKYVGFPGLLFKPDSDIVIPVVELSILGNFITQLVKNNNSIHVRVTSDPNPYIIFIHSPGKYAYQTLMVCWWLGISILAVVKLVEIMRAQEVFRLNLAISCLFLELFCCLIRVLEMILSPMRWNETIPIPNGIILTSVSFPFEISACILLVFFWLDMTKTKVEESHKMLGRFQNISILLCSLLFVLEISVDTVTMTIIFPDIIGILTGIYLFIALIVAIIYHIAGIKLFVYSSQIMRKTQMRSVTIKVQISGFAITVTFALGLAQLLIDRSPTLTAVMWGFIWVSLGIKTIAQILVFGTPRKKVKTTQSTHSVQSTVDY